MKTEAYISIGRAIKTFGLQGEIKLAINENFIPDLTKASAVFFLEKGKHLPYFIQQIKGTSKQPILQLEDINNKELAHRFASKEIFLRSADVTPENITAAGEASDLKYGALTGFKLINSSGTILGIIQKIEAFPQQEMAYIQQDTAEVLIPLNEHFIVNIDETKKEVVMELPEGLL